MESNNLITRWANLVDISNPLPEYPRPQFKREKWLCLNGKWKYFISKKNEHVEKFSNIKFNGEIIVPFPIESYLSRVQQSLKPNQKLWYYRKFKVPDNWNFDKENNRIFLNIGAADWKAMVWINNKFIGEHLGGYSSFSFDITDALKLEEENEILISCWDPSNKGNQERGKQSLNPWGIFYTAVSGIWRTVWIEPISKTYIGKFKIRTDVDNSIIFLDLYIRNNLVDKNLKISVEIPQIKFSTNQFIEKIENKTENLDIYKFQIKIDSPHLWSFSDPYLYDIKFKLELNDVVIDNVDSYFGMRKISLKKDQKGIPRIALNNEIIFLYGPLDQGYWPDGLYTAPTDDALKFDIEIAKRIGFNCIRKHVKIEPERWYYYCDKLGMLVLQDMPNGGRITGGALSGILFKGKILIGVGRNKKSVQKNYYNELLAMINFLYNHPSIIMWIPFNEGWGQFQTENVVKFIENLDSTRLINNASGWIDYGVGHIHDIHSYPEPKIPPLEKERALICGEFGGLGLEVEKHTWKKNRKWSYRKYESLLELEKKYMESIEKLKNLKELGLAGAIYTQLTDVEGEVNGLLTYDREIIKINENILNQVHKKII